MHREDIDKLKEFRNICIRYTAGELIYPENRVFLTLFRDKFPNQCQRVIDRIKQWDAPKAKAYLLSKFHKWHRKVHIESFGMEAWLKKCEREGTNPVK